MIVIIHRLLKYALPVVCCFPAAAAQTTDSLAIAEGLAANAPEEFPTDGYPNIRVVSRDSKFVLAAGGMVKLTTGMDWGAPLDDDFAFTTSEISTSPRDGNGAAWRFSAQNSYLFLNAVYLPGDRNQVGAYINFNFNGKVYTPELQYAYIRWRGLTAGYAYTLFTDMAASASTIDYQGPNSFTGDQMPVVNYEKIFGRGGRFGFGIGMSMPIASITDGNDAASVTQRLPDIPAYLQVNWGGSGHFRFSALLRNLYYRDCLASRNVDVIGWGIKGSVVTPIAGALSACAQAAYGKGITSYYQDLTWDGLDLANGAPGRMEALKSWGGYAGLNYDFSPKAHLSCSYSYLRLYSDGGRLPDCDAAYRYAQYVSGTFLYDISSWLSAGVEYLYGSRRQTDGALFHTSRAQAALMFNF